MHDHAYHVHSVYSAIASLLLLGCIVGLEVRGSEAFFIGQRSPSVCAEHDSLVVPVALSYDGATIPKGTTIVSAYTLRATHPSVAVHPCGASRDKWRCCDDANCPSSCPQGTIQCVTCAGATNSSLADKGDGLPLLFETDDASDQIYALTGPSDIGEFEVIINGVSFGMHPGIVLGSRWELELSWPQDVVIVCQRVHTLEAARRVTRCRHGSLLRNLCCAGAVPPRFSVPRRRLHTKPTSPSFHPRHRAHGRRRVVRPHHREPRSGRRLRNGR